MSVSPIEIATISELPILTLYSLLPIAIVGLKLSLHNVGVCHDEA